MLVTFISIQNQEFSEKWVSKRVPMENLIAYFHTRQINVSGHGEKLASCKGTAVWLG
jgi:hypothetical protein